MFKYLSINAKNHLSQLALTYQSNISLLVFYLVKKTQPAAVVHLRHQELNTGYIQHRHLIEGPLSIKKMGEKIL